MKDLLRGDKGVSEMVGYVLLVVIAVSLGGLVFTFLRIYVPSSNPVCPGDVALSIEKVSCESGTVQVRLKNRGLFNLDGAYIRIGDKNRIYKNLLNGDNIRFTDYTEVEGLPPGSLWPKSGSAIYSYVEEGLKVLEIEPAMFVDNEFVLCDKAIIKQPVYCTGGDAPGNNLPVVNINNPQNKSYLQGLVLIDYIVTNANSCSYNLTSNGEKIETGNGCVVTKNISLQNEGDYNFTVIGKNTTSGDEAVKEVIFSVQSEAVPPEIVINDPKSISYTNYPIPVNITIDGLGTNLDSCWIELNGFISDLGGCKGELNFNEISNITNLPDGNYPFNVTANNSEGLKNSKSITFIVDIGIGNNGNNNNPPGDGWTKAQ